MFLHVDGRSRYGYCRWVTQCWVLIFSSKCHREKMLGIKAWECLWRCWLKKKKVCMFANAQVDAHKRASENRHLRRDWRTVIYHWRGTINAIFISQHETLWTDNIQKCVSESSRRLVWDRTSGPSSSQTQGSTRLKEVEALGHTDNIPWTD